MKYKKALSVLGLIGFTGILGKCTYEELSEHDPDLLDADIAALQDEIAEKSLGNNTFQCDQGVRIPVSCGKENIIHKEMKNGSLRAIIVPSISTPKQCQMDIRRNLKAHLEEKLACLDGESAW
jgi:hypothetical protein